MLAYILLGIILLAGVLALLGLISSIINKDADPFLASLIMGFAITIIPTIVLGVGITDHVNQLAVVRQGEALIQVRLDAIEDINQQFEDLNDMYEGAPQLLFNGDTPIGSLIEAKADFVAQIAATKMNIVRNKIEIEATSIGLMSGIVDWYGRE